MWLANEWLAATTSLPRMSVSETGFISFGGSQHCSDGIAATLRETRARDKWSILSFSRSHFFLGLCSAVKTLQSLNSAGGEHLINHTGSNKLELSRTWRPEPTFSFGGQSPASGQNSWQCFWASMHPRAKRVANANLANYQPNYHKT